MRHIKELLGMLRYMKDWAGMCMKEWAEMVVIIARLVAVILIAGVSPLFLLDLVRPCAVKRGMARSYTV